jgi:hypothetical protein
MNSIVKCNCGEIVEVNKDNIIGRKCISCNEISILDNFKGRRCSECDKSKYKIWREVNSSNWKSDSKYYKYVKKSNTTQN